MLCLQHMRRQIAVSSPRGCFLLEPARLPRVLLQVCVSTQSSAGFLARSRLVRDTSLSLKKAFSLPDSFALVVNPQLEV